MEALLLWFGPCKKWTIDLIVSSATSGSAPMFRSPPWIVPLTVRACASTPAAAPSR